MSRKTITAAYVFANDPDGQASLVGQLSMSTATGTFKYSDHWLSADYAYPLDPVNLPLSSATYSIRSRSKVFSVFSDAGPDDWGTKVMLLGHKNLPANEIERLLACSGHGAGCLQFSLSRSRPKQAAELPHISLLSELEKASLDMANENEITDDMYRILAPGTSMGGARPKVSVWDGQDSWIAKFALPQDPINMPTSERATLELAKQAGIKVPETRMAKIGNHQALLVKRFDRGTQPVHFISAFSLFNQDRVKQYSDAMHDPCSYLALARTLRAHSSAGLNDCLQLYRRMVFNTLIGNIDDHARNHAMIYRVKDRQWQLSPAYDIVPIASASRQQALGVGRLGRESSIDNLLSASEAFGIDRQLAAELIEQQIHIINGWREHFTLHQVPKTSLKVIEKIILPSLANADKALRHLKKQI